MKCLSIAHRRANDLIDWKTLSKNNHRLSFFSEVANTLRRCHESMRALKHTRSTESMTDCWANSFLSSTRVPQSPSSFHATITLVSRSALDWSNCSNWGYNEPVTSEISSSESISLFSLNICLPSASTSLSTILAGDSLKERADNADKWSPFRIRNVHHWK